MQRGNGMEISLGLILMRYMKGVSEPDLILRTTWEPNTVVILFQVNWPKTLHDNAMPHKLIRMKKLGTYHERNIGGFNGKDRTR